VRNLLDFTDFLKKIHFPRTFFFHQSAGFLQSFASGFGKKFFLKSSAKLDWLSKVSKLETFVLRSIIAQQG